MDPNGFGSGQVKARGWFIGIDPSAATAWTHVGFKIEKRPGESRHVSASCLNGGTKRPALRGVQLRLGWPAWWRYEVGKYRITVTGDPPPGVTCSQWWGVSANCATLGWKCLRILGPQNSPNTLVANWLTIPFPPTTSNAPLLRVGRRIVCALR